MKVETLAGITTAFEAWRSRKRHPREAVPADLLERARRLARRHGPAAVARATKVDRGRLSVGRRTTSRTEARAPAAQVPAFSRVQLGAPAGPMRLFAEVEMPTGLKLRLFEDNQEALGLLSSLLNAGGAR